MAKRPSITAYHDPNPVHFTLTQPEFNQLCEKAKVPERENTLFLLGLLIPSAINLFLSWPAVVTSITTTFVLNAIVVIVSFILCCLQGRQWWMKRGAFSGYINELKNKPQVQLELTNVPEGLVRETKPSG